ncbi:MBL fold metallo-hydrolase [Nonomuraea sp. B5E05]|uniref:MBL fold metallo-hydrolase n=1 Tax=Nonomuraea sp. B5E05 TaxID=3153569 RepID=UPI003261CC76
MLVVPGVHRVPGFTNSYLIESGDGTLVLVDCGFRGRVDKIVQHITALGHTLADVTDILLTHHHLDHTGGLPELSRRTDATVHAHAADAPVIRGQAPRPGADRSTWTGRLAGTRIPPPARPAHVHAELTDGQTLPPAGGIRVIHTPGHTMGHCSFLLERDGGLLLAGDAALHLGKRVVPPIPLALNENLRAVRDSFDRLGRLPFRVAAFGTGAPIAREDQPCWRATPD